MRHDLEQLLIPGCVPCQHNKSSTTKPAGPLHPLPIPDQHGNSIAMDFIGPLPEDEGYNCLLTITDRLGSDVRLISTCTDITAEKLAKIFSIIGIVKMDYQMTLYPTETIVYLEILACPTQAYRHTPKPILLISS